MRVGLQSSESSRNLERANRDIYASSPVSLMVITLLILNREKNVFMFFLFLYHRCLTIGIISHIEMARTMFLLKWDHTENLVRYL